jgi:hypothetical protein
MNRLLRIRIAVLLTLAGGLAAPAFAHFTPGATPHAHAGDTSGLLVVVVLVAIAAWIDRRQR